MGNLRDIRRHIRGIKSTQKITRSMQMVAATRMRRTQRRALSTRPYAEELSRLFFNLLGEENFAHPLGEVRPVRHRTYLIVTSDRGLCGSFNSSLIRQTLPLLRKREQEGTTLSLIPIGRKGFQFFRRRGYSLTAHFTNLPSDPTTTLSEQILQSSLSLFTKGETDEVWLIFNRFVSTLVYEPVLKKLLPLQKEDLLKLQQVRTGEKTSLLSAESIETIQKYKRPEPLFEPSQKEILDEMLPRYLNTVILQALLESIACEYSARMTAMDQATRNAEEIIGQLTLSFNKARQASITKEILEVVGGAEALTKG